MVPSEIIKFTVIGGKANPNNLTVNNEIGDNAMPVVEKQNLPSQLARGLC